MEVMTTEGAAMINLTIKEDFDYSSPIPKICALGEYKGRTFVIIYIGAHPCAYVECKTDLYKQEYEQENFPYLVHGGFTWYGPLSHWIKHFDNIDPKLLKKEYVGWDYAHFDDYTRFCGDYGQADNLTRWTTDNIIECIIDLIDWMDKNGIN